MCYCLDYTLKSQPPSPLKLRNYKFTSLLLLQTNLPLWTPYNSYIPLFDTSLKCLGVPTWKVSKDVIQLQQTHNEIKMTRKIPVLIYCWTERKPLWFQLLLLKAVSKMNKPFLRDRIHVSDTCLQDVACFNPLKNRVVPEGHYDHRRPLYNVAQSAGD